MGRNCGVSETIDGALFDIYGLHRPRSNRDFPCSRTPDRRSGTCSVPFYLEAVMISLIKDNSLSHSGPIHRLHRHLVSWGKGSLIAVTAVLAACDSPTMPEAEKPETREPEFAAVQMSLSAAASSLTFTTSSRPIVPGLKNQGFYAGRSNYGFSRGYTGRPRSHQTVVGVSGSNVFRTYYTFDLAGLAGTVVSARLVMSQGYWVGGHVDVLLSEVTTHPATLSAGRYTPAIFNDLGDGTVYGSSHLPWTHSTHAYYIPLNAAAVSDIQTAAGGYFSIGAAPTGASGRALKLNGPYASNGVQQLIVEINLPPVADAGVDHTLKLVPGLHATLNGLSSSDPEGDALTYEWKDSDGMVVGSSATASVPMSGIGSFTYTLTVKDAYGQTDSDEVTITVELPPEVSSNIDGTQGDNEWYVTDVSVGWDIETHGFDLLNTDGCGQVNITVDQGAVEYTCTATTIGGTGSETVTVKRDATPPVVDFAGNVGRYDVADMISISCSATDNLSGVATHSCDGSGVEAEAWSLALGEHQLSAEATDNAGTNTSAETSFEVTVSISGVSTLVERWVSHGGTANSLQAKLENAAKAKNAKTRNNVLGAFVNQLEAQAGKKIPTDKADLLIAFAQAMIG
jgi:K319-like protein